MNLVDHIFWIDLPHYKGECSYKGETVCYQSNPQQIDAAAVVLNSLLKHGNSCISVLSILRTHHKAMCGEFRLNHPSLLKKINFFYGGQTCNNANTLIVLPVMASGTTYEPVIEEIEYKTLHLFNVLKERKFDRVIVVGEKKRWLSIKSYFSSTLSEIPATDYVVRESFFEQDIQKAVEELLSR
ncbi:hypothetical protein [Marinobacter sp.]|uniref:hypothetical protein n=1 Tax=Marinobacter sp. TaxID=50741 RepID=UPI003A90753A